MTTTELELLREENRWLRRELSIAQGERIGTIPT